MHDTRENGKEAGALKAIKNPAEAGLFDGGRSKD